MTFDPLSVTKHGLTYITLSHICSKKHLYLLSPLSNKNFHVHSNVQQELLCFKKTTQYKLTILNLKSYQFFFIFIAIP
jgi:hypothetical protein